MNKELDNIEVVEEPKHIKRKIKKKVEKSSHKHTYEFCLLEEEDGNVIRAKYCTLCGKINNRYIFETCETPCKNYGMLLKNEEVKMKYSKLRLFNVIDNMNKYVDVL